MNIINKIIFTSPIKLKMLNVQLYIKGIKKLGAFHTKIEKEFENIQKASS